MKVTEHKTCDLIFPTTLSKTERDTFINVGKAPCEIPVTLVRF
jgi:hypothetical protein